MALDFLKKNGFDLQSELEKVQLQAGKQAEPAQPELEADATQDTNAIRVITGARLPRRPLLWDVHLEHGKIASIEPHHFNGPSRSQEPGILEASGKLITPSLCHAHIHLDKCFLLQDSKFSDLQITKGDFSEAMELTNKAKARFSKSDLLRRGRQLIIESIHAGVTAMRAFVEVDGDVMFKCLDAGITLKREFATRCDVQICAFAQLPLFSGKDDGDMVRKLMQEASVRDGVDVLGSTPYVEDQRDKEKQNIDWITNLAVKAGKHLDLHLDYHLDRQKDATIWSALESIKSENWIEKGGRNITIGHCTRLTYFRPEEWKQLKEVIGSLPVYFVGLPTSDLFMMRTDNRYRASKGQTDTIMEPLNIGNTLRAHHQLRLGLYMPDMMLSVSHRQQARTTAQDQIAELRVRKAQTINAAQRLFVRLKDSMDAQTFHHVLQGIMDIHNNKRTMSAVVEELRPLVATRHPQLFEDFLNHIDPTNDLRRVQATNEPTTASEPSRQLLNAINVTTAGTEAPPDQNRKEMHCDQSYANVEPTPLTVTDADSTVHFQKDSSLYNLFDSPMRAEGLGSGREHTYASSPGMAGFPAPPEFYSPVPQTFAQNFMDYTNQEVPLLRFPMETPSPFHDLPMPTISPTLMTARSLPPVGRFGPGMNPHSPAPASQMGPPNAFPTMPQYQHQFQMPKNRLHSSISQSGYAIDSRSLSVSPYGQAHLSYPPLESSGLYDDRSYSNYGYNVQSSPANAYSIQETLVASENAFTIQEHTAHFAASKMPGMQASPASAYSAQQTLVTNENAFTINERAAHFAASNMPDMQATRQAPLQRKRGMSDLRSSAEQSQPRKVSKTHLGSRVSRPGTGNTPGRNGTPPDDEAEKPYIHHICGRRFTTLEAVKGHHHNKEDGLGCWIRYGGKEKDKAWDLHPSCKTEVDVTWEETAGTSQDPPPQPANQPRTSRPARQTSRNTSKKDGGKRNVKEESSSPSEHHVDNSSDEYLPELGMTQKQLNEIQGARPKRAARKASQTKRAAIKK
ncbi:hypothetical protein FKW77_008873 [Venturia effusa]|uniref:Amidohydrolase-related domain-containing protein n=1 Tax=Venturia effusa TaxID=50376 RepID=A0A517KX38_9PEZI|nr:hypothetical protein FKW77_008873 [Venturia effusa]